ncbi:FG-GAP repeat domain-containing protein [Occallatibacter riparius]|uniref:VCBS repeat-containing protein n=1 Tax=Occallatibacter riparius TaxID=1002689 RepID=A0A9J7BIL9_9BACT|nr:VCBS repeat-containing protein [Occallatibacter riparius]UWZ82780.1 VCBS repeat-containing protein [Occallatibacter riparius]
MPTFPGFAYRALAVPALAACALFPLRALTQTSPTFAAHTFYNGEDMAVLAHGDFNNDGREDLIARVTDNSNAYLYLSNSDGTYNAPIQMSSPNNVPFAVGDFNHDGNLDLAVGDATGRGVHVLQGHGDGTFTDVADLTSDLGAGNLLAIDVNHDSCTDLVVVASNNGATSVQTWKSNCSSTASFTKGQYLTSSSGVIAAYVAASGDFDGDGKPDLALIYTSSSSPATRVQVWYGDGAGNFANPIQATDPRAESNALGSVADLDDNGTSDLVMTPRGSSPAYPYFVAFKGNTNRTLTFQTINTPNGDCTRGGLQVADFNGDGLNDIAYTTMSCSSTTSTANDVRVLSATGKGVFGAETSIYSSAYGAIDLKAVKSTQGTRPDLVGTEYASQNASSYPPVNLYLLENNTSGGFPGCGTTKQAEGIRVCSPSTASANSPVKFSISAAGPTPMRTVAVWADGTKLKEQLTHAFSNYSFLDQSISLGAGTHNITIYGTGWDNTLQKKSFSLTVGTSGCAAPSGYGVNVCSPVNGSTVHSPVQVTATAHIPGTLARMEIWANGVKKYTETTSTSLSTTVSLTAGTYQFDIYAVNTAGAKYETTVRATVQ